MKTIKFYNIEWDDDGDGSDLPDSFTTNVNEKVFNPAEEGADLLSDQFGFCVKGFKFEEVLPKTKTKNKKK